MPISFGFGEDLTKTADTCFENLRMIYTLNRAKPARRFLIVERLQKRKYISNNSVRENETNSEINVRKHRNLTF